MPRSIVFELKKARGFKTTAFRYFYVDRSQGKELLKSGFFDELQMESEQLAALMDEEKDEGSQRKESTN
jgi:hypothetical protein